MFLTLIASALAGGDASPKPPPAPAVDFAGLPASASVQPKNADGKDHPVHARLLLDRTAVAPGETVRVGLYLTQQEGWHTYWKSPGEIGLPTEITWNVPGEAKPYQYPVPQRFEQEDLVSFGYEDAVLLFSEVTVPADAAPGTVPIGADATWLVCKTSCIPGKVSLAGSLTVGPDGTPTPWAPLFDHYAAQHPSTSLDGYQARVVLSHDAVTPYAPFGATLILEGPERIEPDLARFAFAPIVGEGWMSNTQTVGHVGNALVARLDAETLLDEPPGTDRIGGLFLFQKDGHAMAIEVQQELPWKSGDSTAVPNADPVHTATIAPLPVAHAAVPAPAAVEIAPTLPPEAPADGSLLSNLLLAFFGGLILNIMPCVLPVLTLKLYSLIEQVDVTRTEQRAAGLAYTAGILSSFMALAGVAIALRTALGSNIGWGFQMQYPSYVAGLATVVFALGLSLFGVFELPAMGVGAASEAGSKEGPVGYFFTGVFATLLATPCSAPILGTATAFALAAPGPVMVAIYVMIGLGLAAPFLLIAFVPALYRLLPRPGAWMDTFKQLLAFSLIATAIWLLGVLGAQVGLDRLIGFVSFLAFVAGGCWIYGHFGGVAATFQRQVVSGLAGVAVAVFGGYFYIDLAFAEPECDDGSVAVVESGAFDHAIPWQPFSEARVDKLKGTPVFIDFTAEWCISCKVNEKTVLETATVREAMAKHGVVPLKADWTRQDPVISAWLERYGKAGVPFYLVLPANGEPIPLGEVITPSGVVQALSEAG